MHSDESFNSRREVTFCDFLLGNSFSFVFLCVIFIFFGNGLSLLVTCITQCRSYSFVKQKGTGDKKKVYLVHSDTGMNQRKMAANVSYRQETTYFKTVLSFIGAATKGICQSLHLDFGLSH